MLCILWTAQPRSEEQGTVHASSCPAQTPFWLWIARITGSYCIHVYTRLLHQETTPSGQMAHQSPILAAASLPKSSSIRSTHSPLCQGWEKAILFNSLEQTQSQKKKCRDRRIWSKWSYKRKSWRKTLMKQISNLLDKEFKEMVISTSTNLRLE